MKIDLHMHTTLSDGTLTPEDLVSHAITQNLDLIAITDHDRLISEDELAAWNPDEKIKIVPGIEYSTQHLGTEIHVLGYFLDQNSKEAASLLVNAIESRNNRNHKIIAKLNEEGFAITWEDVKDAAHGDIIGRPHIARALVDKGCVPNLQVAFQQYLADGAKCFVKREELPATKVLEAIKSSGGLSCLAHPAIYGLKGEEEYEHFIGSLANAGLDAIEVYYSKHSSKDIYFFRTLAEKLRLMTFGGSDFHGTNKKNVFLGRFPQPEKVFETLEPILKERGFLDV